MPMQQCKKPQKESPVNGSIRTPGLTADATVFCHRLRRGEERPRRRRQGIASKGCLGSEVPVARCGTDCLPTSGFAPSGVRLNRSGNPKVANTAGAFQQLLSMSPPMRLPLSFGRLSRTPLHGPQGARKVTFPNLLTVC